MRSIFIIAILLLASVNSASAKAVEVEFHFGSTTVYQGVAELFMDSVLVCTEEPFSHNGGYITVEINGEDQEAPIYSFQCDSELITLGEHSFTMTGKVSTGETYSPTSPTYSFSIDLSTIENFRILP